jgi:hypothetical protein
MRTSNFQTLPQIHENKPQKRAHETTIQWEYAEKRKKVPLTHLCTNLILNNYIQANQKKYG